MPEPSDQLKPEPKPRVVPGPTGTRFAEVRWFESLDSTNRYLLNEARRGADEGLVVVADHQSAGRGRLGRRWEAPSAANLLVSVLLRPQLPAGARHLASSVVAMAAADACAALGTVPVDVKWPNDLLVGGRKLAGVLAEADMSAESRAPIVVGIGINVAWPPPPDAASPFPAELGELADSATSLLRASGRPIDRARLLSRLLVELEPRVAGLDSPEGREAQAADLRGRCTTIGARVRVETVDGAFTGTALDVTLQGHLVVDVDHQGPRTVVVGDVIHLRTAPEQGRSHE
ncbi:MAG TPA: biotin--[acetyl-CoA-carboxylase] ligase [Acidimicrobiales bacterium]|jgi:BirA family biotin operon repressor/biotin-[acetyl-CoA-carboxylase] ligase|nr:biotin--[acetyl-CoA-carboxylase] ligase [Acidimicrobiales bacterium]